MAINPSTAPYPLAPKSASGTAPRTIVITPCEAPSSSVKATSSQRSPRARKSSSNEAGTTPMAMRAMVIALRLRPKKILDELTGELAMAFEGGDQTAVAPAMPAASSSVTSCNEMTPNTNPLSDMIKAKRMMPTTRMRPSSAGPSGEVAVAEHGVDGERGAAPRRLGCTRCSRRAG